MLFLVDSRKHWLHCQNMCSISCWTTLSWGEFCFLTQQLFTFDNMIVFYFQICCKLLALSSANRKKQQFLITAAPLQPLFDNILYLIVYRGTILIRPNSATLLRHYSRYLTMLQNTNYSLCIALSFQPLGYKVDDTKLKRAGLDYWPYPQIYASLMLKPLFHLNLLCYLRKKVLGVFNKNQNLNRSNKSN